MFRFLQREKIVPLNLAAGDSIQLTYDKEVLMTETVSEDLTIDEIGIFEVRNGLGFSRAIGGIFGKSAANEHNLTRPP